MGTLASPIEVDWSSFDPWRIQPVRHRLEGHPLLQLDQLIELGKRLERDDQTLSFNAAAGADADFNSVARTHPNRNSTVETLQQINDAKAWMLLRHVQTDPVYRTLVDTVLDAIKPQIDDTDPGMCYRAGWIFVSSPHSVTPFHIDRNHVLLLQLSGTKTVYVWDADDVTVVSDHARARFLDCHQLDLVRWHEEFRARAHVFELGPGMGVYMPLTSPHMVEIGSGASLAMSVSYNTAASRHRALLHVLRERLHERHIELPPIGSHPLLDGASHAGARALIGMHRFGRRLIGRPSLSDDLPYAVAE